MIRPYEVGIHNYNLGEEFYKIMQNNLPKTRLSKHSNKKKNDVVTKQRRIKNKLARKARKKSLR